MRPGHRLEIPDELRATDYDTLVIGVYKVAKALHVLADQVADSQWEHDDISFNWFDGIVNHYLADFSEEDQCAIIDEGHSWWMAEQCNLAISELNEQTN